MSIFKNPAKATADFRARFAGSQVLEPLCKVGDPTVLAKLKAAEKEVSRRLRVFLETTQVLCENDANTDVLPGLIADKTPYALEPGYDYSGMWVGDDGWNYLLTRQKLIQEVQSYRFSYLGTEDIHFNVPLTWLRLDRKYGHIRLLPSGINTAFIPLSSYLLSVFGGGRTIPNMIRIRYTAGIKDIEEDYPDLLDFIYRYAAFSMIRDLFPGSSSSISVDGLSQTQAFTLADYADKTKGAIEAEIGRWIDIFQGVRVVVA